MLILAVGAWVLYAPDGVMAVDERRTATRSERDLAELKKARKWGYGIGLLKGMAVTLKHLFKHNTVIEYPDVRSRISPPARAA